MAERVIDIVEDYLAKRISGEDFSSSELRRRIKNTGVSEDMLEDILIEIDDELDRERLNQITLNKSRKLLFLGPLLAICFMTISILSAMGFLFNGRVFIIFYGVIAVGILTGYQAYFKIKKSKLVKERREIKWRSYDRHTNTSQENRLP